MKARLFTAGQMLILLLLQCACITCKSEIKHLSRGSLCHVYELVQGPQGNCTLIGAALERPCAQPATEEDISITFAREVISGVQHSFESSSLRTLKIYGSKQDQLW